MKVSVDQLPAFLERHTQPEKEFPRVFFLSGDEPLQLMEAADQIRSASQRQGFADREVFHTDAKFDWSQFGGASSELSLFSEKKILDVRVAGKSPGKAGSQAIRDYVQHIPEDKVLLLQTARLDKNTRNSAWVKALEKHGVMIQVWDLSPPQTMAWIVKRMRAAGMHPSQDAVRLLTERIEGNLLAALQEINKLKLLYGAQISTGSDSSRAGLVEINDEMVLASVSDCSRFSIFDLSSAIMTGDAHRVQHIHHQLKQEGTPVQLVLWTLTDLTRQLYDASFKLRNGVPESKIVAAVPRPKQTLFRGAIRRMQYEHWPEIIAMNSEIDRLSKGQGEIANKGMSRTWQDLLELGLLLTGSPVLAGESY